MNLKKWLIFNTFGIFLTSSLCHFIYKLFPNFLTSLIFPVNESIWEHNKIIILSFLIWSIITKLYYKDNKNYLWSYLISSLICALLVMLTFTPVYFFLLNKKDNILITLIIFLIMISISQYFNYKLLVKKYNYKLKKYAFLGFILIFILNAFLTYYPSLNGLFYDYNKNIHGISK